MRTVRALADHQLTGPMLRYALSGAVVAGVYLGLPLVLNGGLAVPIQIAIPIAYVLAVSLHFTLQRHFVFRQVARFALTGRQQAARYVLVGLVQYPTTAIATAVLPSVLGMSERATFVCASLVLSLTIFLVLRTHVFHAADAADQ